MAINESKAHPFELWCRGFRLGTREHPFLFTQRLSEHFTWEGRVYREGDLWVVDTLHREPERIGDKITIMPGLVSEDQPEAVFHVVRVSPVRWTLEASMGGRAKLVAREAKRDRRRRFWRGLRRAVGWIALGTAGLMLIDFARMIRPEVGFWISTILGLPGFLAVVQCGKLLERWRDD